MFFKKRHWSRFLFSDGLEEVSCGGCGHVALVSELDHIFDFDVKTVAQFAKEDGRGIVGATLKRRCPNCGARMTKDSCSYHV